MKMPFKYMKSVAYGTKFASDLMAAKWNAEAVQGWRAWYYGLHWYSIRARGRQ